MSSHGAALMIPSNFITPHLIKLGRPLGTFLRRSINFIDIDDDSTSQKRCVPNWN